MVSICNKPLEKMVFSDLEEFLNDMEEETVFFELKSDKVSANDFVKEVSAFSNTFGGYIILGVEDDKTITGCSSWGEQKIHTVIHNGVSPTPIFTVKKLEKDGVCVNVVRIEEGQDPPYVTNKGVIYERVSSGSCPVNDSGKLSQLYYKRQDQLRKVCEKIELDKIDLFGDIPNNLCGYLDLGFSITCRDNPAARLCEFDFEPLTDYLKECSPRYSVSQIGQSYLISFGGIEILRDNVRLPVPEGLNNFIQIFFDGSVRCRILLLAGPDSDLVNLFPPENLQIDYEKLYQLFMGENFAEEFVEAKKYEKLTVIKQFVPFYDTGLEEWEGSKLANYLSSHCEKYGNNLIALGGRVPPSDYQTIDRSYFERLGIEYNTDCLVKHLFLSMYFNLGFIDNPANDSNKERESDEN